MISPDISSLDGLPGINKPPRLWFPGIPVNRGVNHKPASGGFCPECREIRPWNPVGNPAKQCKTCAPLCSKVPFMLRPQLFAAISLLTAAITLSACVTQGPSDVVFPASGTPPAPASATAEPPAAGASSPVQTAEAPPPAAEPAPPKRRQAAAGRAARAPEPAPEPKADDGPFTITKAREQCWMKYETEKAGRGLDLDKKAGLVQKCVDDKMNASIGR
jgi:hypothetical protein